jgi:integrase
LEQLASSPFLFPNANWGHFGGDHWNCVASASLAAFATVIAGEIAIMAWLEQRGDQFHLGIRIGDRKLKRSLQTNNPDEAQRTVARVERRLKLIEQGDLVLPEGADLVTFLLSDGKLAQPVNVSVGLSLKTLCDDYLTQMPAGTLEANTVYTIKIHLSHIRKVMGDRFSVEKLKFADLQRYVDTRSKDEGRRGKKISTVTIRKELTTFSGIWTWASRMGIVKGNFPNRGLRYPKTTDKSPFQTWTEIERQIEMGGLSDNEQTELWEGLYLTANEIEQVLNYAQKNATHPVFYPMLVLAAHTGARRSEIVRSEIADFDLSARTVRLRELKRARGKRTMRTVPMSDRLTAVMQNWLNQTSGKFTFEFNHRRMTVDDASTLFDRTLANSRWDKIRGWHVFRHSFISNCASSGVDQRMIDAWSGHQTEEMRKRYRHLFPTVQREALQSVFG